MTLQRESKRVLVVDDEASVRGVLIAILSDLGFEVETANNGKEAIAKQRKEHFPIILSDIVMPDCDGFELMRELQKEFPETRVIAMSGGGPMSPDTCLRIAMQFGARAILPKPFTIEQLSAAIEKLG